MFNFIQAEYALIPLSEENYYMATAPVYPRLRELCYGQYNHNNIMPTGLLGFLLGLPLVPIRCRLQILGNNGCMPGKPMT